MGVARRCKWRGKADRWRIVVVRKIQDESRWYAIQAGSILCSVRWLSVRIQEVNRDITFRNELKWGVSPTSMASLQRPRVSKARRKKPFVPELGVSKHSSTSFICRCERGFPSIPESRLSASFFIRFAVLRKRQPIVVSSLGLPLLCSATPPQVMSHHF